MNERKETEVSLSKDLSFGQQLEYILREYIPTGDKCCISVTDEEQRQIAIEVAKKVGVEIEATIESDEEWTKWREEWLTEGMPHDED